MDNRIKHFERGKNPKTTMDIGRTGERGKEIYIKEFKEDFKKIEKAGFDIDYRWVGNENGYSIYGSEIYTRIKIGAYTYEINYMIPNQKKDSPLIWGSKDGWNIKRGTEKLNPVVLKGGTIQEVLDYIIPIWKESLESSIVTYNEWLSKAENRLTKLITFINNEL